MKPKVEVSVGSRWKSTVSEVEVIVVRAAAVPTRLQCGGRQMQPTGTGSERTGSVDPDYSGSIQLGKRYANDDLGIEILCTKGGDGMLSADGAILEQREAKPLPSSD